MSKDNYSYSVMCKEFYVYVILDGEVKLHAFNKGILRLYTDYPRIEYKDEYGIVSAYPMDMVNRYQYVPVPKCEV